MSATQIYRKPDDPDSMPSRILRMKTKSLREFIESELAKIPATHHKRIRAILQRQSDELLSRGNAMAQEIEAMSRAFGKLPTPMHMALLRWRGEEVSKELLAQLDVWNTRQASVARARAAEAQAADPTTATTRTANRTSAEPAPEPGTEGAQS